MTSTSSAALKSTTDAIMSLSVKDALHFSLHVFAPTMTKNKLPKRTKSSILYKKYFIMILFSSVIRPEPGNEVTPLFKRASAKKNE